MAVRLETIAAISLAPAAARLLAGPLRQGTALGGGHLDFDGYVVSLTGPGASRLPNGIECTVESRPGEPVALGEGLLRIRGLAIVAGPQWNPRPGHQGVEIQPPGPAPDASALAGLGPGLTPAGDDLIAGYAAGLELLHRRSSEATELAEAAARRTTSLSATLLRHAARGELPEAAHDYLERGSESALLRWGASSGRMLLAGLQLAGASTRRQA